MARKKKRPWGRGSVEHRGQGITIRWREKQLALDGSVHMVHRCEQLGEVTITEAVETLKVRKAAGVEPKPQPVTFSDFVATWKANVLPLYPKYSTRKHHGDIAQNKLVPYFGKLFLHQLTTEHVQQFVRQLELEKKAPHTIHHYHTVLGTILSTAKKWKRIVDNPASGVVLPALKPVREQWVLTYEEARRLLIHLEGRTHVAVAMALSTGMRRGELFAARWRYFDPSTATLLVCEAIYDHHLAEPKTSSRIIPVPAELVKILNEWRSQTKYGKAEDFILAGRRGIAGDHARILRDYIKPTCIDLQLKAATWLTFRRTWATWADGKGISAKIRGTLMGNSEEVNQRIYTKVIPADLRDAVEVVGTQLYATCTQQPQLVN